MCTTRLLTVSHSIPGILREGGLYNQLDADSLFFCNIPDNQSKRWTGSSRIHVLINLVIAIAHIVVSCNAASLTSRIEYLSIVDKASSRSGHWNKKVDSKVCYI